VRGKNCCLKYQLVNLSPIKNLPRFNARWKVIERLKALNLWRGQNEHAMNLPTCSRTGDVIEPMMKEQWFARASQLFDICSKAVESGELRLMPENRGLLWKNYCNVYKKDWCISRQLWWGQRIPAYRCRPEKGGGEEKWFVGRTLDEARNKAVEHFKTDKLVLEQG
jgi:valyl-tRNA synthetase